MPGFDLTSAIKAGGLLLVGLIVFSETGLFVGFFLPGDSLLFTAGFLASQGAFDGTVPGVPGIVALAVICGLMAILGDTTGYLIGRRIGPRLFTREDSVWFHKKHLARAHEFYEKHGGRAIVLAQFMPVVRTFSPVVAGIAAMPYQRFAAFNVLAALLWGVGVPFAGFFLGRTIPDVDKYLLPIVAVIIVVSIAPSTITVWRENRHEIMAWVRTRRRSKETASRE